MTDLILLSEGMKLLKENFGSVNAERFVSLIIKEQPFDYVKWRQNLYEGMELEEISDRAMSLYESAQKP